MQEQPIQLGSQHFEDHQSMVNKQALRKKPMQMNDEEDGQITDIENRETAKQIAENGKPTSIEFVTPHYSMDFKNGETITDYKMSAKVSSGANSNRMPVDQFIN